MIYANQPIMTRYGKSVNIKLLVNGYEISLACDDSCGVLSVLSRVSLCIFDGPDGENITKKFLGCDEFYGADSETLMRVMGMLNDAPFCLREG